MKRIKNIQSAKNTFDAMFEDSEIFILKDDYEDILLALDKQISKKPIKLSYKPLIEYGWEYQCPSCGFAVGINKNSIDYTQEDQYCSSCGQRLEWD